MERESFVWADSVARCVVAKFGQTRIYVAFDWDRRNVRALAKYHCYDMVSDFIGEVEQVEDSGLLATRLPGFVVLLNCTERSRIVNIPWLMQTAGAVLPREALAKDGRLNLAPGSAVVVECCWGGDGDR